MHEAKCMSFSNKKNELLEKSCIIQDKVSNSIIKEFESEPV